MSLQVTVRGPVRQVGLPLVEALKGLEARDFFPLVEDPRGMERTFVLRSDRTKVLRLHTREKLDERGAQLLDQKVVDFARVLGVEATSVNGPAFPARVSAEGGRD